MYKKILFIILLSFVFAQHNHNHDHSHSTDGTIKKNIIHKKLYFLPNFSEREML